MQVQYTEEGYRAMRSVASTPGPSSQERPVSRGQQWLVTVAVMAGTFLAVMDISVVNVSMPHMMGNFGQTLSAITWVATSYSIAEMLMITMAGWWSALLGRKRLYLASLVLFTLGSMLAGTAQTFTHMLCYRILQGIGGGSLIPISQAILRETYPPEEQGMAMAIFGMGVVLAPAMGPILGGWLTDNYGWPWVFYINIPVSIVGLVLVSAFVEDPPYLRRGIARVDWAGIGLLTLGLTGMQVELRTREPIIQFRVLRNIPLSVGAGMDLVFGMVFFGTTFSLPQLTQQLLHYPAYQAGLVLMPRSLTLFLLMPLAGWLFNYVDSRLLIAVGIGITYWAFYHLAQLSLNVGFWNLVPIMLLMGAGMPCVFVTLSTVSLRTVNREDMTAATSLYTLARSVGGNLGYALVATLLERFSIVHQAYLSTHISRLNNTYPGYATALAARLSHQTGDPVAAQSQALALVDALVHRQAAILAYNDVARVFGVLFLCTLPLLLLFPRTKRTHSARLSPQH